MFLCVSVRGTFFSYIEKNKKYFDTLIYVLRHFDQRNFQTSEHSRLTGFKVDRLSCFCFKLG